VTHAFYTRGGIDQINGRAFGDGIGRALGQTRTAIDAFFGDFQSHCFFSLLIFFSIVLKVTYWRAGVK
jgi:hypothetical protein